MLIRLLSDLHLEVFPYEIKYEEEDLLILAGDISSKCNDIVKLIQNYLSQNKNVLVIFVLGNHDYYHKTITETTSKIKSLKTQQRVLPQQIVRHAMHVTLKSALQDVYAKDIQKTLQNLQYHNKHAGTSLFAI